jgi:murein hydrolase activator
MRKLFMLLAFILVCFTNVFPQPPAQNRGDLEKERTSIQKEIEEVKSQLEKTHSNKKQTLGQLALLQKKLRLREAAVSNINHQLNFIQADMKSSWQQAIKLKKELDTLRKQYGETVVYTYENRTNYDYLNFLFASSNFNDAIKRVEYLKSYRTYREERAANIQRTEALLENKINVLKEKRIERDVALTNQNKEKLILESEKKEKDEAVAQLKGRETELKKEMKAKQRQDQKLGNAIFAALSRAREESRREIKKREVEKEAAGIEPAVIVPKETAPVKKKTRPLETTEDIALSGNFENNRGHLPWPVESRAISMQFGLHKYPNGTIYNNKSITIESGSGTPVYAVFDGSVYSVFIVGDVTAIMVRHGKYFTTYSNLSSASVSKGQFVRSGQILGKLADIGQLEFYIYDVNNQPVNPELWLKK